MTASRVATLNVPIRVNTTGYRNTLNRTGWTPRRLLCSEAVQHLTEAESDRLIDCLATIDPLDIEETFGPFFKASPDRRAVVHQVVLRQAEYGDYQYGEDRVLRNLAGRLLYGVPDEVRAFTALMFMGDGQ